MQRRNVPNPRGRVRQGLHHEYIMHNGKSIRVIRKDKPEAGDPFDWHMRETASKLSLPYMREPYDTSMIPMLNSKMLPRLVDHILGPLDPQRKRALVEKMQSVSHAKQRAYEKRMEKEKEDREYRARRLTRKEKSALRRLKDLLRKS